MRNLQWITLIMFFFLVVLTATHSLNSINQDIGRHLKSGEIIWETKNVYQNNLFSYTEPDHRFINHHWLSEVFFYLLNGLIGLRGLIIFKAALLSSAFFLIWFSLRKIVATWAFIMMGILGSLILLSRSDVRPEIFSYLFLVYFLLAIFESKYNNRHGWLYALPIVQIFWTNMHIYFALGPMLVLFFLVDRLVHRPKSGAVSNSKRWGFNIFKFVRISSFEFRIFILVVIATIINPNFISGALAPLTILRDYGYSIIENQNIFFLSDYGIQLKDIYLFEISLVVLISSFIVALKNGRRKIIFELLTTAVFVILAGSMIRNFGPYALLFTSITTINFSPLLNKPEQPTKKARVAQVLLYGSLIFMLVFFGKNTVNNKLYQWLGSAKKFGLGIPNGAVGGIRFIQENRISGPVFNNFDVGSFLIWKMFPEEKVFVDGRPEAYGIDFFEKIYKPMQEDPAVWKRLSEEYKINYIFFAHTDITPWARTFLAHISQNLSWPLVYLDGSTAVFLKRVPENLELIQKFEIKK